MKKVTVLFRMNHVLMTLFSRRTTESLKRHALFRLMLPTFQSFLDFNLGKEIEKDRCIIQHAESIVHAGKTPGDTDIQFLLDRAREIDRTFLQEINPLPIKIQIQYHAIETIRLQRITQVLDFCYSLLRQWQGGGQFRTAIQTLHNDDEFERMIYSTLRLYCQETRQLSHSIRIPLIMGIARDSLSQVVYDVMDSTANQLAIEVRRRFYP